jgi:hypothetical protein
VVAWLIVGQIPGSYSSTLPSIEAMNM